MSKEYVIESINDFLKIPDDKFEKCLTEFIPALTAGYRSIKAAKALAYAGGAKDFDIRMPKFIWTDDDKDGITIRVNFQKVAKNPDEKK